MKSKKERFLEARFKVEMMAVIPCRCCGVKWPRMVIARGLGLCPNCQKQHVREY